MSKKQEWYDKHDITPDADGWFPGVPECKKLPIENQAWLDNIASSMQRGLPSMQASPYNPRTMVFVGGGFTAKQFVEEIRAKSLSPEYDVFCSNKTGEWLLQNGIVPKFHMILDAQAKKAKDVALTHPDVTYLIATNCDPSVFDALKDRNVKLFFCASNIGGENLDSAEMRKYLKGPMLMICGGTMAGVRSITLAEGLGYRKLECYGVDGCIASRDEQYAYDKKHNEVILDVEAEDGRVFLSTPLFADQVRQILEWKKRLPWIRVKFYGDSFMSHMNELDEKKSAPKISSRASDDYLEMQKWMHEANFSYGTTGKYHAPVVYSLMKQLSERYGSVSVLDYGCGKCSLREAIERKNPPFQYTWQDFDPAISEKSHEPKPADLVICTDVMEHVEAQCIPAVLDHIEGLTKKLAFFNVSTVPSKKLLPNGENAHITLREPEFWNREINKRFVVAEAAVYEVAVSFVAQSVDAVKTEIKKAA